MKIGKIEGYLYDEIKEKGCIHLVLMDPEKTSVNSLKNICKILEKVGTTAILVGGSTGVTELALHNFIEEIKKHCSLPTIIFPSGVNSIAQNADAIFFMSLLNSQNPYYLIEAQMLAAPIIRKYGIEAIPVGYIIVGEGEVVGYVGWARPLPFKYSKLVLAYAMAAEMLGMRSIYLEAGSGASVAVPDYLVKMVKDNIDAKLIIGGGIKNPEIAKKLSKAGADMIVTGTLLEDIQDLDKLYERLKTINESIRK